MAASIREAAIEIFSDDPLERFRQGQQAMLPQGIDLPEPPQRGDLDINVLRDAPYFFS
jgi:DNA-directed RNA polymerase